MAITAITTSNSMRVNPLAEARMDGFGLEKQAAAAKLALGYRRGLLMQAA